MKKISIFLICSLLMIFGLSFSACADAVTTGGVTATAVAPRAVDSSGNIIDVSENINQVEHTAFAKENATTTETTTTKPAYGNVINNRAVLLNYYSLSSVAVITAADGILSDPALRSRLVYRLYLSTNSYLMIIFDSFAYETFKDENLKIISSMLDELKITLIQQKAVNK